MNSETDPIILGYTPAGLPIWQIAGSEGDDDIDTSTTEEDDNDEEGDGDEAAEWTPPTKEEWDRQQAALTKANAEAKKRRLAQRKKVEKDGDGEDAAEKATAEAEQKYKARTIKFAARGALASAGVDQSKLNKAIRLLDLDDLDLSDDDEVDGLDDQIEELKEEFPELFAPKEDRTNGHGRRIPRVNGAGRQAAPKAKTSADLLAAALSGKR